MAGIVFGVFGLYVVRIRLKPNKKMGKLISVNFKKYNQAEVAQFANNVINSMTKDAQFITLKPFVDDLNADFEAFTTAVTNAIYGGTLLVREKKRRMVDLNDELETVANQVEALANGNEDVIEA